VWGGGGGGWGGGGGGGGGGEGGVGEGEGEGGGEGGGEIERLPPAHCLMLSNSARIRLPVTEMFSIQGQVCGIFVCVCVCVCAGV